jgi:membrane protein implicated in regulation of membrane protease activity
VLFTFALAVVVGAVAALALGSWWILAGVVAVHFIASGIVVGLILRRTEQASKPDPVTEARLEEEQAGRDEPEPKRRRDEERVFGI